MEINDFVAKFAEQFEDTDKALFAPDVKFRDLDEWDSLTALSIIAMVDEEYGVKLSGEDIRNSSTLQDIFNICKNK